MKKASPRDRLRYRFDNTLSRGTVALIAWLAIAAVILIIVAIALDLLLGGVSPQQGLGPIEVIWSIMFQTLVPNPPGSFDNPWQFLVVMLAVTVASLLLISILIGILTTGIQERVERLRRGRSRVIEAGHTVILGWSPQVFSIISELALANRQARSDREDSAAGRNACVVILADRDKVEMEEKIRTKVPDTLGTRVVCRSGNPLDPDDLKIVSPETARAIMVISPGGPYPDLPVAKTMMALAKDRDQRDHRYHIVAALHKPTNLQIVRMIGGDEAQVFAVDNMIARLTAQTCRQSGLSVVYGEILSFEGAAIRFCDKPGLVGNTYADALFRFPNATLIGLQYADGRVEVNPPMEAMIRAGDRAILITAGIAEIRPSLAKHPGHGLSASSGHSPTTKLGHIPGSEPGEPPGDYGIIADAIRQGVSVSPPLERLLILGWNRRGPTILEQLGYYMPADSQVRVVAPVDPQQMQAECAEAQPGHVQVTFERGNPADRPTLERLAAGGYQYIVILSPADASDVQIADATSMVPLLHLRDIARKAGTNFSIVSEILDVRNRDLAEVTSADDVIISERLVALALTQIAENKAVLPVFIEFLGTGGAEIYLKPASDYVAVGTPINFYTVLEAARRQGHTALGYRRLAEASLPERAFGVHLNPDKAAQFTLAADDRIIVLAED